MYAPPTQGQVYNIPITIWLSPNHPYTIPRVHVVPTEDMNIKPSQVVDSNGVVSLPYLTDWKVSSCRFQCTCI